MASASIMCPSDSEPGHPVRIPSRRRRCRLDTLQDVDDHHLTLSRHRWHWPWPRLLGARLRILGTESDGRDVVVVHLVDQAVMHKMIDRRPIGTSQVSTRTVGRCRGAVTMLRRGWVRAILGDVAGVTSSCRSCGPPWRCASRVAQ